MILISDKDEVEFHELRNRLTDMVIQADRLYRFDELTETPWTHLTRELQKKYIIIERGTDEGNQSG